MKYELTFSYKFNGTWKKVSKIFEDENEMKTKIKNFLENENLSEQRYWIDNIIANGGNKWKTETHSEIYQ